MDDKVFKEFPTIETERLVLRKLSQLDSKDIFDIFSSETIMKFYGMYPIKEVKEAENLISSLNKAYEEKKSIRWGIILKEEDKLIGTCGYHNWNKSYFRAEMGYELSSDYWRKGYITEAIKGIIPFGFNEMNLNRIEAQVYPENKASNKCLQKLGFVKEGVIREYAFFRDKFEDLVMYSLLKNDISI